MRKNSNRILVVSADSAFRESAREVLRTGGFAVFLAGTGYMAIREIRDRLIDAVVLDNATPFTKQRLSSRSPDTLRALTDQNPFLPVVLTCRSRALIDHATFLMADAVLESPIRYSALLDAVKTVVGETLRERAHRKAQDIKLCS